MGDGVINALLEEWKDLYMEELEQLDVDDLYYKILVDTRDNFQTIVESFELTQEDIDDLDELAAFMEGLMEVLDEAIIEDTPIEKLRDLIISAQEDTYKIIKTQQE